MIYRKFNNDKNPWCQCACEINGHPYNSCDYLYPVRRSNNKFVCDTCFGLCQFYIADLVKIVME
jgi:hypothetical protein